MKINEWKNVGNGFSSAIEIKATESPKPHCPEKYKSRENDMNNKEEIKYKSKELEKIEIIKPKKKQIDKKM